MNIKINDKLIRRVKELSNPYLYESENIDVMIEEIIKVWIDQVTSDLIEIKPCVEEDY